MREETFIKMATNKTPITDLIVHLDSYMQSHISASSSLKSAIWDLNKARRQRGRNAMTVVKAYSALDVREELRAQSLVECMKGEPLLQDEDDESKKTLVDIGDLFVLRCVGHSKGDKSIVTTKDTIETDGIRQRKIVEKSNINNDVKGSNKSEWSEEIHIDEKEEQLLHMDPLELFGGGLVPRDLKLAQKHAKECLASYVAAANEVAAITRLLAESLDKVDNIEENEKK